MSAKIKSCPICKSHLILIKFGKALNKIQCENKSCKFFRISGENIYDIYEKSYKKNEGKKECQ